MPVFVRLQQRNHVKDKDGDEDQIHDPYILEPGLIEHLKGTLLDVPFWEMSSISEKSVIDRK